MKNRVGPEAHGEILAGRIARAYEKGRPEAQQGDEYWFFIKHFASISRGGQKRRDRERARESGSEGRKEGAENEVYTYKETEGTSEGWFVHRAFLFRRRDASHVCLSLAVIRRPCLS